MRETHPFGFFVPRGARYLLLGSFTTKENGRDPNYDWFYGTKRNHFWPIMEQVYGKPLKNKAEKQKLFSDLKIGLGDIIKECERVDDSNLDVNLINAVYHIAEITQILAENKIEKIFFSSKGVANKFGVNFKEVSKKYPGIELVTLPSSSPRYAAMRFEEKIRRYKAVLPLI